MTQLSVLLKMLTSMTVKLRLDILKGKPASPPFPFSFPTSYCTSGSIKWACCHESIILPATFSTQVSFGNPFLGWHTLSIKTLTDSRNAPRSRKTHEKKLQRIVDHKWLSLQVAAPKIFTKKNDEDFVPLKPQLNLSEWWHRSHRRQVSKHPRGGSQTKPFNAAICARLSPAICALGWTR